MLKKLFLKVPVLVLTLVMSLATVQAQNADQVTLRFPSWQWGQPGYDEFLTEAINAFEEKHPNVTIKKIPIPSKSYTAQLIKMFASGDPPEIVHMHLRNFNKLAAAGWLEPLDERLKDTDIAENWVDFLWEAGKQDGHVYGLYISGTARMLYYNKQIFEEAGLEVPTTPEEMVEAAKALTKTTSDGTQYGFSIANKPDPNLAAYGLNHFVSGLCGNWAVNGEPNATSPEVQRAIEIMRELVKSGTVPEGADRIGARQVFWEGKAAMLIEGPWVMTSIISENPDLLDDVGLAPIPFPCQIAALSNGFAIAKEQDHKDLAWEFISMIASEEWMQKYVEMTAVTSGRDQPLSDEALEKYPWMDEFAEVAEVGVGLLPDGMQIYTSDINQIIANSVAGVLFGDKSVEQATQEIQMEMEELTQ